MSTSSEVASALRDFASDTRFRLYDLTLPQGGERLLVEAFFAVEELQTMGIRDLIVLSTDGALALKKLLGKPASLGLTLADGKRCTFSGIISEAAMLGGDGGLARYRLRLTSFLWLLSQCRNHYVWQDKTVPEIVDDVLRRYPAQADWRWSGEVLSFMEQARSRSYCVQYRESDLDFIARLLTAEGLAWRIEEHGAAPAGHRLVLFADSTQPGACPEDACSASPLGGPGIRYHGARPGEQQDTIQALVVAYSLAPATVTTLSYDDRSKKIIAASVPTRQRVGGKHAPLLESYDTPGMYAYGSASEANHYACLHMEAIEARRKVQHARSTVRTLRPGTRLTMTQGPLAGQRETPPDYLVSRVVSVGINNLPARVQDGLAELFGPIPQLLEECAQTQAGLPDFPGFTLEQLIEQARSAGYANACDMLDAGVPWRPVLADGTGLRLHPRATALGSQSAIVVGPDGADTAHGADELHCDRLGRVRIRFHWQGQGQGNAGCWVRVAQRSAGGGMGSQFLPRIGQEVLVKFLENDIDRPIIVGALYNGRGEGGVPPTPGGIHKQRHDDTVFAAAHDHAVSGQGNLAGGNSPAWHGASAGSAGQRNNAAQWGIRSKEFGGHGYNQLLFDDTDRQGRVQLKSTQAASELNLGHLIHSADNYRGSLRGLGAELRTDGYGAVRAGAGLLLSTYALAHQAGQRDPAGDNTAGLALLKQAVRLANTFSAAALSHQSVGLAGHLGSYKAGASMLADDAAPLAALLGAASGMLAQDSLAHAGSDAAARRTAPSDGTVPHSTDPIIAIAAKGGLGVVAGQDLQLCSGETVSLMSGQDSQFTGGGQLRWHSGQAIGVLGGAAAPGEQGWGLQLIAARQAIALQAQSDVLNVQARDDINVVSANAHIDWAAAKSIRLSTAGGASITIEGGNITVQCPGKITVHAGTKNFSGPARMNYPVPKLPRVPIDGMPIKFDMRLQDVPGLQAEPYPNSAWRVVRASSHAAALGCEELILSGLSDDDGLVKLAAQQEQTLQQEYNKTPNQLWLVANSHARELNIAVENKDWSNSDKFYHGLDALGYADDHVSTNGMDVEDFFAPIARTELKTASGAALLKKIKKGSS